VLPNFVPGRTWIGFVAPRDLPSAIQTRLNSEIVRILHTDDVLQILSQNGLEPVANSPSEFTVMIREDAKIWDEAADIAGLVPH
jgi:tripartite-type tricarboxylate transporter receptor subunit TctC